MSKLINKNLKTDNFELTYKIYEYNLIQNSPKLEEYRFVLLNELKKKYNLDITKLFLLGYAENLNNYDPVVCTNLPNISNEINTELYKIVTNIQKYSKSSQDNTIINLKELNDNEYLLSCSIESIPINKKTYNRIKNQTNLKQPELDKIIWCLIYRYGNLNLLTGLQGAVLPEYYKLLNDKYNSQVECFGSFMNHYYKYYFGLFYDLEKYFGCLGNFFNAELIKGFYVANPPFDVNFMNNTFIKFTELLSRNNITLFIILPAWVIDDRKLLNNICRIKLPIDYENDLETRKLKNSKYIKKYMLFCKEDFPYYDYFKEKKINYAPTNIVIMSSDENYSTNVSFLPKKNIIIV